MTNDQQAPACPRCGSAEFVHTVQELASSGSSQPDQQPDAPQQGWTGEPQQGPVRGWEAEPQAGPPQGPGGLRGGLLGGGRGRWDNSGTGGNALDYLGDGIAGVAEGLLGRAIGRRVQRAMTERVVPAMQARQQAAQQELVQRYPDLCACVKDKVFFLAGGSRVAPMASFSGMTPHQADGLVAYLRGG